MSQEASNLLGIYWHDQKPGLSSAMWRRVVWYNITRVLKKSYSHDLQGRISCALRMEAIDSSDKFVNLYETISHPWIVFCIVPAVRISNVIDSSERSPSWEVPQPFTKFTAFYVTWRFITTFTKARHLSLSQINQSIQSMPLSPSYSLNIHLILSWRLCISPLCTLIPSGFQTKTLYAPLISPINPTSRMSYSHAILSYPKCGKFFK